MSELTKLLDKVNVTEVEYVYPEHIQARLDEIDRKIEEINDVYAQRLSSPLIYLSDYRVISAVRAAHFNAVAGLLSVKNDLIVNAVPKVIIHVEEKSTLY